MTRIDDRLPFAFTVRFPYLLRQLSMGLTPFRPSSPSQPSLASSPDMTESDLDTPRGSD